MDKDDARDHLQQLTQKPHRVDQQILNDISYKARAARERPSRAAMHQPTPRNCSPLQIMWQMVESQLRAGLSVIVDSPFARVELYHRACELADQRGAKVVVIELQPRDESIWRKRVDQRGFQIKNGPQGHRPLDWAAIEALRQRYGGCDQWTTDGSTRVPWLIRVEVCRPEGDDGG